MAAPTWRSQCACLRAIMLEVRDVPGRGRGLFSSRAIRAGEVVLAERPLLLVPNQEARLSACSSCLRFAAGGVLCPSCGQAVFCSTACLSNATSTTHIHSPELCRLLSAVAQQPLTPEQQSQARFLLHILAMQEQETRTGAGDHFSKFLQLAGTVMEEHLANAAALQPFISNAIGSAISTQDIALLLSKEQVNAYGILASVGQDGERRLRGSAIYLHASLINHECLPTVARFDNFDRHGPSNSTISFRAMHDLPAGTELVQSYVPLSWSSSDRQQHLKQVYGFECKCLRCLVEASPDWQLGASSSDEWETDDDDGNAMHDDAVQGTAEVREQSSSEVALSPTYLQLFLLKYICPRPDCQGLLAPVLDQDDLECNLCGSMRSNKEFLAELEER